MTTTHANLHQEHIEMCLDCHRVCLESVISCLAKGGAHADPVNIERLLSCSEACQMCAHSLLGKSGLAMKVATLCAEFCESCAVGCEQFPDDAQMKSCAEQCRRCADQLRTLSYHDATA